MPLFAYICKDCGTPSELLVRADEPVACTKCGSKRMERQPSRFAPMSGTTLPEPACSGCSMAEAGRCPSQSGCMA